MFNHQCKICLVSTDWTDRCREHTKCDTCGGTDNLCGIDTIECSTCESARVAAEIKAFDGDTDYTDDPVCPWCGTEQGDAFEMQDGEHSCQNCARSFEMTADYTVNYSTKRVGG